jgi:hypothetical protein
MGEIQVVILLPETVVFNNVRRLFVLFPILAIAGCSGALGNFAGKIVAQPDPTIELLESELRWMEDNLYRMDYQLDCCLEHLESARRNNATLRIELAENRNGSSNASSTSPALPTRANTTNDVEGFDEEKALDDEDLYDLSAPVIKLGVPAKDEDEADETNPAVGDGESDPSTENPDERIPRRAVSRAERVPLGPSIGAGSRQVARGWRARRSGDQRRHSRVVGLLVSHPDR